MSLPTLSTLNPYRAQTETDIRTVFIMQESEPWVLDPQHGSCRLNMAMPVSDSGNQQGSCHHVITHSAFLGKLNQTSPFIQRDLMPPGAMHLFLYLDALILGTIWLQLHSEFIMRYHWSNSLDQLLQATKSGPNGHPSNIFFFGANFMAVLLASWALNMVQVSWQFSLKSWHLFPSLCCGAIQAAFCSQNQT